MQGKGDRNTKPLSELSVRKRGRSSVTTSWHFQGWLFAVGLSVVLTIGCQQREEPRDRNAEPTKNSSQNESATDFQAAFVQAAITENRFTEARQRIQSKLVQEPNHPQAWWLLAQLEGKQANFDQALAALDQLNELQWQPLKVAEFRRQIALKSKNDLALEQALLSLVRQPSDTSDARRALWQLYVRQGRRHHAARWARIACEQGRADVAEMASLLFRLACFPATDLHTKSSAPAGDALHVARWHAAQQQWQESKAVLNDWLSDPDNQTSPASQHQLAIAAFFGRTLAELQEAAEFSRWLRQWQGQLDDAPDYWAAMGAMRLQRRDYSGCVSDLLQLVRLDPTDRTGYQRLGQALDGLGRHDDAEQARHRGVLLSDSERLVEQLSFHSTRLEELRSLSSVSLQLGQPFMAIRWSELATSPNNRPALQAIAMKRQQMRGSPELSRLIEADAMLGLQPDDFSPQLVWESPSDLVEGEQSLGTIKAPAAKPIGVWRDVAKPVGLDFAWQVSPTPDFSAIAIHQSLGGGIGVIDYDLDGWPDVYLSQASGAAPKPGELSDQVFRNIGGHFQPITHEIVAPDYAYSAGVVAGDLNQDGWIDLLVANLGPNRCFINNGDGTFSDQSQRWREDLNAGGTFSSSLAIADLDGDAIPDIYEGNYIEMDGGLAPPRKTKSGHYEQPSPLLHYAQPDRIGLQRPDQLLSWQSIDREAVSPGTTLGVVVTDFDGDGKNEVFTGNDGRPNHLLRIERANIDGETSAKTLNRANVLGIANGLSGAANGCMGIATGDFDHNGRIDLQIANFVGESINLYLQSEQGFFVDASVAHGLEALSRSRVGFGTKAIDVDGNGWLDFFTSNGHIFDMRRIGEDFKMPPDLWLRDGTGYSPANLESMASYWQQTYLGRTVAKLDFDGDLDSDLLVGHLDAPYALLENNSASKQNSLQIELVGTTSERDATGASVIVKTDQGSWTDWVVAGDGYLCTDQTLLEFTLGDSQNIQSIEIRWPSGHTQQINEVDLNRRLLVIESQAGVWQRSSINN